MNYIKQLQQENKEHKTNLDKIRELVVEMECYMLSDKFHCGNELDGYVSTQDILHRVLEIRHFTSY